MDLWNESNSHLQQLKDFVPRGAMLVSVEFLFVFVGVDLSVANRPMEMRPRLGASVVASVFALVHGVKDAPRQSFCFCTTFGPRPLP